MPKFFVASDIHSYFSLYKKALDAAGYDAENPNHWLIVCGDYFDRGPEPLATLDFFEHSPRSILIKGNHEDLFEDLCNRGYWCEHDVHNGTIPTVLAFGQKNPKNIEQFESAVVPAQEKVKPLFNKLIPYFETENYIFVHGWIPCKADNLPPWYAKHRTYIYDAEWRDSHESSWKEARWINGMDAWSQGAKECGKTIVCGHWHTSWGHAYLHNYRSEFGKDAIFTPFKDDGILAIDACTAYSERVNIVVIEDEFIGGISCDRHLS